MDGANKRDVMVSLKLDHRYRRENPDPVYRLCNVSSALEFKGVFGVC